VRKVSIFKAEGAIYSILHMNTCITIINSYANVGIYTQLRKITLNGDFHLCKKCFVRGFWCRFALIVVIFQHAFL